MWTGFIILFGLIVAVLGAIAVLFPERLLRWLGVIDVRSMLLPAAFIRLVVAVGLWLVATESTNPGIFRVLAVVMGVAAIAVVAFGHVRVQRIMDWWMGLPPAAIRGWGILVVGLGLYLMQALVWG